MSHGSLTRGIRAQGLQLDLNRPAGALPFEVVMYRTICCELWTDPKVKALSVHAKLLFLYCITNTHSHLSGLYYLPIPIMQHETQLGRGMDGALQGLITARLIDYEPTYEQVWVVNMFKFQGRGQKTERGVAYYLHGLHATPLIARFLLRYPQIVPYLPSDFCRCPIDTPSMEVPPFPSPISSSSSILTNPDLKSTICADEFEEFWKWYPKKIGKKDAYRAWQKAKDKPNLETILKAIAVAKQSEQWTKDNGQFIPNPSTWLNQGRWTDEPIKGVPNGHAKIPPFPGPDDPIGRGQWRRAYGDPAHPKIVGT